MKIENKTISIESPCYFIADIAANHDGNLERAKDLIWKAAEAGADAAKFQHFSAETIVSDYGFKDLKGKTSHQSSWKKSVFEVYKEASINNSWNSALKSECDKAKITFFTSPYSLELVDAVDEFVPAFKIGSGDITWHEIIKHIASKQKPYILATGASTFEEVQKAHDLAKAINPQLALLQCNTNYTGSLDNMRYVQLNVLKTYKEAFPDTILGLSDHTPGHATVLGAVALGARIVEKHFTDDTSRDGPDHAFSMSPTAWNDMVIATRELEAALGGRIKKVEENELETCVVQRRSIRLKIDLPKNAEIKKEHLEFLRPCPENALPPYKLDEVIGKVLMLDKARGDCLYLDDLH